MINNDIKGSYLAWDIFFAPVSLTFSFSISLHEIAARVELGYEYEI